VRNVATDNWDFATWDNGRVTVNRNHTETLRAAGLCSFQTFMHAERGEVAKNLRRDRTTLRINLRNPPGEANSFYLKRHLSPPWKEYVKPLLRFRRPIVGARNEWHAIQEFHRAGIPTMVPVAFGECGTESFLLTEAIDGCAKLSEWMQRQFGDDCSAAQKADDGETAAVVDAVARLARRMHSAGLHHQDFYLTHLLLPTDDADGSIYVIDLGRARRVRRLSSHWIVKDLAQLNYSARLFPQWARRRFLETYLDRCVQPSDRRLIRRIERKTARIARHGRKHNMTNEK